MIGLIVQSQNFIESSEPRPVLIQPRVESSPRLDPLSEILSLIKPTLYVAGGFAIPNQITLDYPKHSGIKCYAVLTGDCFLVVMGISEPVQLRCGDCFLLPRGLPFQLTTDLSLEPMNHAAAHARFMMSNHIPGLIKGECYIAGGHFALSGDAGQILLSSLPPIVLIRRESDKSAMRSSLERMREELTEPQPGTSLMVQNIAHSLLLQALRLHIADASGCGWLAALADRRMCLAITSIHHNPGYPWTLESLSECVGMSRSGFALRFRQIVGITPMEYLTRWRMLLAADRLINSTDNLSGIAQSLGYVSESAFGKAFRRVMGSSPRQYMRDH